LYELGRSVERAHHVIRILEVNHKMNLERSARNDHEICAAISESFGCGLDAPDERSLYGALVLSPTHPCSVRFCVSEARDQGRAMREHISEEIWLHLNRTHLEFQRLTFDEILGIGRSEFNRRVEVFADALHGLADDTMIRGDSWGFLRLGKLVERASMVCRILEIKRKSISSDLDGGPVDVHQWQALLRSVAGYEPYRRAYDARVVPARVLEFVLQRPDFPRSLVCTLNEIRGALAVVGTGSAMQARLDQSVSALTETLNALDPEEILRDGAFEGELRSLGRACQEIDASIELAYFTSLRPAASPITVTPGAGLVPQQ
ncbi:MAG: alpha-E domain-containing protein, partial [Myxococcota bacterium]